MLLNVGVVVVAFYHLSPGFSTRLLHSRGHLIVRAAYTYTHTIFLYLFRPSSHFVVIVSIFRRLLCFKLHVFDFNAVKCVFGFGYKLFFFFRV